MSCWFSSIVFQLRAWRTKKYADTPNRLNESIIPSRKTVVVPPPPPLEEEDPTMLVRQSVQLLLVSVSRFARFHGSSLLSAPRWVEVLAPVEIYLAKKPSLSIEQGWNGRLASARSGTCIGLVLTTLNLRVLAVLESTVQYQIRSSRRQAEICRLF